MTHAGREVEKSSLGRLTRLAEGGQGRVYSCERSPLLYKEYLDPALVHADRLAALVELLDGMPQVDRRYASATSAFPQALVTSSGAFTGFLMPPAPDSFWSTIGGQHKLQELQYLTFPQRRAWSDLSLPSTEWRTRFLIECAQLFCLLHRHHVIIGDVSMRNLLWSSISDPGVFLLDCDSVRLHGQEPAVPAAYTPDWDDPHDPLSNTLDSDRYKLGLIVLRVLTRMPAARPETVQESVFDGWPARLRELLVEAGSSAPGARPTAQRWLEALENRGRIQLVRPRGPQARSTRITPAVRPSIALGRP